MRMRIGYLQSILQMKLQWQVNVHHFVFAFFLLIVLGFFAQSLAPCSQRHEAPQALILASPSDF